MCLYTWSVYESWWTHIVPSCCPRGVIYIKQRPRRRSKSRISRVDLLLTVSYSVSSSTPDHIPPSFPQTCSSSVIWRLWPWELPGLLWSLVWFVFTSAIDGEKSGQTGPERTRSWFWGVRLNSRWRTPSTIKETIHFPEVPAQILSLSFGDKIKVWKNAWVMNYTSPKIATLNVIKVATTPIESLDKWLKVELKEGKQI